MSDKCDVVPKAWPLCVLSSLVLLLGCGDTEPTAIEQNAWQTRAAAVGALD